MVTNLAKRAMTTKGQKACIVIDHLVEALGNDPSSSLRRALILTDIDQYPGTTQAGIMERLHLDKSTVKRETDWLFDYGCIRVQDSKEDGRAKQIEVTGYSKQGLDAALGYFDGKHEYLKILLEGFPKLLKQEKPTLRDAKIAAVMYEKPEATKQEVIDGLYNGSASTDNRAYNKLREDGVLTDAT
ncbi:MAG: MarR family transcriptional regulator [Alphaproteobacteria bacterium]